MIRLKGNDLKHVWKSFTLSEGEDDFYIIYSHYHHYLSFIGYKRYFSEDAVKDTINDVFLYLWENRSNLSNVGNYHNYILTCFLRKLYRKNVISPEELHELQDIPVSLLSPSVEDQYIQQGTNGTVIQIVKTHIGQLAARQRSLIYQKFYLGLSYQEIAMNNKISINTVYNTMYKAIDKLKSAITKEQETYLLVALGANIFFLFFFKYNSEILSFPALLRKIIKQMHRNDFSELLKDETFINYCLKINVQDVHDWETRIKENPLISLHLEELRSLVLAMGQCTAQKAAEQNYLQLRMLIARAGAIKKRYTLFFLGWVSSAAAAIILPVVLAAFSPGTSFMYPDKHNPEVCTTSNHSFHYLKNTNP
ncbi:hypothetical protein TH53_09705 [Pedobacter lusitanus]|uniref:RNA polymerase sigma factor 70 region 4 type 2 domain-containing protein n=1 Tax=Pedobacter lusitanus TaxID=1503925 RepID=A0A0D0F719_9SPHI|nr:sigma factor-like helix-turn-helix DNA-binding protein [Pedobacter lusitanus]KIO77373.1 hypothetical protein TH53_09705 [Pedobacter lusitanus]